MSIDAHTKVELKIPQLTLAKITQIGGMKMYTQEVSTTVLRIKGSIPVRSNFFAEFILL